MAGVKKKKGIVDGEWVSAKEYREVTNPFTKETIALMPLADESLIDRAIDSAHRAFKPFAAMARFERSEILYKIDCLLGENAVELATLICEEGGKPIKLAKSEVDRSRVVCRLAAEEATRFGGDWLPVDIHPGTSPLTALVGRVPVGPTLAISPFNFPLNLIMHKLAPAIAVGCPVIVKPSSETPLTALMLGEICEKAGCPKGTVQILPCPGKTFERAIKSEKPAMVSFTGSAEVGWHIQSIAGKKRVALELGGNAAAVVDENADLNFAAQRIAFGGFAHAGQICISVQRVFVHDSILDKFTKILLKECAKIKAGDPKDEDVLIGPMITTKEADRIEIWVDEAVKSGAKMLLKGKRTGDIIGPIVLTDVPRDAKVQAKEVFGPVVMITGYKDWDEALDMVNDSIYGLQAGVFTSDIGKIKRAYDKLEVGAIIVNDIPTVRVDNYPYGGVKESGRGREGIKCTMNEMTEEKVLLIRF